MTDYVNRHYPNAKLMIKQSWNCKKHEACVTLPVDQDLNYTSIQFRHGPILFRHRFQD